MDHTWKILGSEILVHTLELKLQRFKVFPYVCIGSHAFAIFAHKKITGPPGTFTTLYQTLYILWVFGCLLALYGSTMHPAYVVVFGPSFFCLVCGPLEKKTN